MSENTFERLKSEAFLIEKAAYYPEGKQIDGAPYSCILASHDFIDRARAYFGFPSILAEIEELRKRNPEADPNCGNWHLWIILTRLGVAKVLPTD